MGQDDVVVRYYEAVDDGDLPGLLQLFHPDAEYRRPGYPPFVGREALEAFYGGARTIAEGRHVIDQQVHDGSSVAVRGRFTGRAKSGLPLDLAFADFFEVSAGQITFRQTYFYAPLV
jgi:steroid Delta-isomerase